MRSLRVLLVGALAAGAFAACSTSLPTLPTFDGTIDAGSSSGGSSGSGGGGSTLDSGASSSGADAASHADSGGGSGGGSGGSSADSGTDGGSSSGAAIDSGAGSSSGGTSVDAGTDAHVCTLTSPTSTTPACGACLESNAVDCAAWNDCYGDTNCTNVFECIRLQCATAVVPDGGIPDGGYLPCEDACFKAAKGNGANEAKAFLADVLEGDCAASCGAPTTDAGAACVPTRPLSTDPACEACVASTEAVCTDWNTCTADPSCMAYAKCLGSCGTGVEPDGGIFDAGDTDGSRLCEETCAQEASGNGVNEYQGLLTELATDCRSACTK
jgi:hypothetical protein